MPNFKTIRGYVSVGNGVWGYATVNVPRGNWKIKFVLIRWNFSEYLHSMLSRTIASTADQKEYYYDQHCAIFYTAGRAEDRMEYLRIIDPLLADTKQDRNLYLNLSHGNAGAQVISYILGIEEWDNVV